MLTERVFQNAPGVLTAPDWWDMMSTAEKFGAVGGLAGIGSLVVTYLVWRDSQRNSKKQLDLAAQANATTKASVEDQIATNRVARSASVRIARGIFRPRTYSLFERDRKEIGMVFMDGVTGITTLMLINGGMAPAYDVRIKAGDVRLESFEDLTDFDIADGTSKYASLPFREFVSLPSGHTAEFRVAMRTHDENGQPRYVVEVPIELSWSDGLGPHRRRTGVAIFGANGPMEVSATVTPPLPG